MDFGLGAFVWDLPLGDSSVGSYVWKFLRRSFRLECVAWKMLFGKCCLGHLLGISCSRAYVLELSLWNVRMGTFVVRLWRGIFGLGSFGIFRLACELLLGASRLGSPLSEAGEAPWPQSLH